MGRVMLRAISPRLGRTVLDGDRGRCWRRRFGFGRPATAKGSNSDDAGEGREERRDFGLHKCWHGLASNRSSSPGFARHPGGVTPSADERGFGRAKKSQAAPRSVAKVATANPPTTARPSGAVCSAAFPQAPAPSATMPAIIARLVMRMGRSRLRAPSTAAPRGGGSGEAAPFGEGHQQNRVGHRDADGHDCAHERLNVEGRAGQPQHDQNACQHRRGGGKRSKPKVSATESWRPAGGKSPRPPAKVRCAGRPSFVASARSGRAQSRSRPLAAGPFPLRPRLLARLPCPGPPPRVGRDRHGALHVVASVLADDRAFGDLRHVAQQKAHALVVEDRHISRLLPANPSALAELGLEVGRRRHYWGRPSNWARQTGWTSWGRHQGRIATRRHPHSHQPGLLAVHLHVHGRIVQGLAELDIAQSESGAIAP